MNEIIIEGGEPLSGEVKLSGSKNAALPVIFATVAVNGRSVIRGVPDIGDVNVALSIIEEFGAIIVREGENVFISTENMVYKKPSLSLTSKIRASSYLIGACLARFGIFHLSEFGGCNFCNRPIDMHLDAALTLGAFEIGGVLITKGLKGNKIILKKPSVGATINSLIMAASAKGESYIFGCAKEPHVRVLADFLSSCGARIEEFEQGFYVVGAELHGGEVEIIPDMIEAGTYILAGIMTGGCVSVNSLGLELESFLSVLSESGIYVSESDGIIRAFGEPTKQIFIETAPHPGYPTDLQPQSAPIMAKFLGGTINERIWQNRFLYLSALSPFGIGFELEGQSAFIKPSTLRCACSYAPDLRGGAAAVITALGTRGHSKIKNAEIIFRGYSDIGNKLRNLGAKIDVI